MLEHKVKLVKKNMKFNFNFKLYIAASSASLSIISLGAAFAWTSPVLPKLNGYIPNSSPFLNPITKNEESWITSIFSLGCMFGPLFAAIYTDKIGKIKTHQISVFCMFISYIIKAFAPSIEYIYVARFILGLGCGCLSVSGMIYLSEIAENNNRGSVTCAFPILFNVGIILVYGVGPYVTVQILSLVVSLPALLGGIICAVYVPESPYYLASINNDEAAYKSLKKLRNKSNEAIQKELDEIKFNVLKNQKSKGNLRELFTKKVLRKSLIITLGIIFVSQAAGNPAILAYMQPIFSATKVDFLPAEISSLIVGTLQMFALIATSQIIDKFGRRTLLLFTTFMCLLATGFLGTFFCLKENGINVESISWLPILSVITFMVCYRLGIGPLPMLIMSELFPSEVKSLGATFCMILYYVLNFLITFAFPLIAAFTGMGILFLMFSCGCLLGIIFMALLVPETKGKSFKEIQDILNKNNVNKETS